jgi:tRNA-dihydrouridine synthase 3
LHLADPGNSIETTTSYISIMADEVINPVEPSQPLKRPLDGEQLEEAHPPQPILPGDSATTKAEQVERNGVTGNGEPAAKKARLDAPEGESQPTPETGRVHGIAPIKAE